MNKEIEPTLTEDQISIERGNLSINTTASQIPFGTSYLNADNDGTDTADADGTDGTDTDGTDTSDADGEDKRL